MKRTLWLAIIALSIGSTTLAQTTTPAPTTPTTPAAPVAPKAPAAPTPPAKPVVAAPAKPAEPAKPAAPAAAAPAATAKPAPAAAAAAKPAPTVANAPAPTPPGNAKPAPVAAQAGKPTPAAAAAAVAPPAAATASAAKTTATPPAKPGPVDWTLDAGHSRVAFIARHLGFSKVEGTFKKFAATIKADSKTGKISALEATADTASIDTGIEKRDAHLKSDDFFNAAQFPQLKLVVKKITWTGNKFTATADLTMRDITKPITLKGEFLGSHTVNFGQGPTQRAGYEVSGKISRKDFGLKYSAVTEGISIVSDEVELQLQAEIGYTAPAAS
jgi:polyisoprenoid-binding protein YceI